MTKAGKRDARAADPRAAQLLDMVEGLTPETMARPHAAIGSRGGADADGSDTVRVAGVRLVRGSRVRLRPRGPGADALDMFLDGRAARVEAVLTDLNGELGIAVTLEGDPGAELSQWHGRLRCFSPDEVEPLEDAPEPRLF